MNDGDPVDTDKLRRGLTGNLDVPGGDLLGMNIVKPYPVLKSCLPDGMIKKRSGKWRIA